MKIGHLVQKLKYRHTETQDTRTYIYIYIYMCVCVCVYIYIHTHSYIHIYTHACIHTYIHKYVRAYIHTYTHTQNGDRLSLHILLKKGKRQRNEICEQMNISWNFRCQVSFRKNTVCFTENRRASYFQHCIVGGTTELITEYLYPFYVSSYLLGVHGVCDIIHP